MDDTNHIDYEFKTWLHAMIDDLGRTIHDDTEFVFAERAFHKGLTPAQASVIIRTDHIHLYEFSADIFQMLSKHSLGQRATDFVATQRAYGF